MWSASFSKGTSASSTKLQNTSMLCRLQQCQADVLSTAHAGVHSVPLNNRQAHV
jgi:hypothetical protein